MVIGPGMDPHARSQPSCIRSPASATSPKLVPVMLQEEASERPFETVRQLAERLGMDPQEGKHTPEAGGDRVFDNCFEAEEHKVIFPDTGSCGAPCAGILRLVCTKGFSWSVSRVIAVLLPLLICQMLGV